MSQTQQFTTNASVGTTLVWMVDNVVGGSSTVGTITTAGLYTPPASAGTHIVSAVSSNNSSFTGQSTAAVTDLAAIPTFHADNARTGQNLHEYALTPNTVMSGQFGKRWTCTVDAAVYAQPLYMANVSIGGGTHNVLYVVSENDTVYAFNADDPNCGTFWQVNFLINGAVISTQPNCHDIAQYGITATPVIDTVAGTMYLVAATTESGAYVYRLHALNIFTGADRTTPVVIQGSVAGSPYPPLTDIFDPAVENPRPGMVLTDGGVYIGFASFCDKAQWQGWFMRYDATSLAQTAVFNAGPNGYGGGIWMSAGAPAVDSSGNIYLSTGNGTFDDNSNALPPPPLSNNDFGMSVLNLNPSSLVVQDFFAPSENNAWSNMDWDMSAAGVTVLPDGAGPGAHPNLLVTGDKEGHFYVIDRNAMSGINVTDNVVQMLTMPNALSNCSTVTSKLCLYSTPTYYNGTIYMGTNFGPLFALPLMGGLIQADSSNDALPSSQSTESYGFPNPTAMISASQSGGAVVWVLDNSNCGTDDCWNSTGATILRAYDAINLGTTLYSSSTLPADLGGLSIKFTVPVVANGHVYIGGSGMITVYGLAP